jgi:hypothetical protein
MTPTTEEINARIDAAIKQSTEKLEALRVELTKPKYEVGKTYIFSKTEFHFPALIHITEIEKNSIYGYGFINGIWHHSKDYNALTTTFHEGVEATPSEVLEALKKEAVKMGFIPGTLFVPVNSRDGKKVNCGERFNYDDFENKLLIGGWAVFINGKWATPIAPVKELTTEDYVKELGICFKRSMDPTNKILLDFFKDKTITPNA